MAGVLQHLRSSTLNKRPNPASMVDGQIAINYASGSPGAFFKDTNGNLVKVGPVHVGATAPNVSPASGGTAGNSLGEQWLDTSGGTYVFKIWDGAAWRSEAGEFVNSTGDTMTGSLTMGPSANLIFEGSTDDGFETTLTVVDPTADRTITLPNVSGTVVTTGDTGTITSTMIADGTIVNADVNASAAIAGTKISPDFGSQTIQTTGVFSHALGSASSPTVTFTGDANTGIYSPGADQVAISTGGSGRLFVKNDGSVAVGAPTGDAVLEIGFGATANRATYIDLTGDTTYADYGLRVFRDSSGANAASQLFHRGTGDFAVNTLEAAPFIVRTNNTERLRITSAGLVGVGTSAPATGLHIAAAPGSATTGNVYVSNTGQARYKLYNGGAVCEWLFGQKTNSDHAFTFSKLVGSTESDYLAITSAGNVGIGTTSPGAIVHSAVSSAGVVFRGSHSNSGIDLYVNDATGEARITATRLGGSGGKFLSFYTDTGSGEFERARIDSSGRLLVGTSSALGGINSTVQIAGTNAAAGLQITRFNSTDGCVVDFSSNRNATVNNYTTSVNGDELVRLRFLGYDGANQQVAAQITAYVDGTPGTNDMPGRLVFSTTADGASSPTPRMTIKSDGNVGIGTTSPGAALNIGADGDFWLASSVNTVEEKNIISWRIEDGSEGARISAFREAVPNAPHSIAFFTRTSGGLINEKARIDSSGRFLVGTSTSINNVLEGGVQIVGTGANAYLTLTRFDTITSAPAGIILGRSKSGTKGTNTAVSDGDFLGVVEFTGADGGSSYRSAAQIGAYVDGAVSGGGAADMPGRLVFSTTADGASSPTERMRITNDGQTYFGITGNTGLGTTNRGFLIRNELAGKTYVQLASTGTTTDTVFYFYNGNGLVGSISMNGSATAYNTSSDYRLKENVAPVPDGITRLQQLKPSRFNFIADPTTTVDGFIAHEVQAVVPEAITGEKDAVDDQGNPQYQGIDQSKLVPLLTAALQEAVAKIETLEARLTAAGI